MKGSTMPKRDAPITNERLWRSVERFSRNEIEIFRRPQTSALAQLDAYSPITFSRLCAYLSVFKLGLPVLSFEDAVTEGTYDCGLDGVAVSLGEEYLTDPEQAKEVANRAIDQLEELEAEEGEFSGSKAWDYMPRVLLVQVKRDDTVPKKLVDLFGAHSGQFLTMSRRQFFSQRPNPQVQKWWEIYDAIRATFALRRREMITRTDLVFAYSGTWTGEANAQPDMAREFAEESLATLLQQEQDTVQFYIWGADQLNEVLQDCDRTPPNESLTGAQLMPLPPGPASGYIGFAPATSIVQMMPQVQGTLDDSVFEANVRAYLGNKEGENPGADGLAHSLSSGEGDEVILRHNGITLVADEAIETPEGLLLKNFQVVNGAQTTHVLFESQDQLAGVYVPVKIVVTTDESIKDEVIRGSNTQSPVDDYDMLSRDSRIRSLKAEFDQLPIDDPARFWLQTRRGERLFERQYDPQRLVTPRQLLEAYVSTHGGEPNLVVRKASDCLKDRCRSQALSDSLSLEFYQVLCLLLLTGREWCAKKKDNWTSADGRPGVNSYPGRFHTLYAFWLTVFQKVGKPLPAASKPIPEETITAILEFLKDPRKRRVLGNQVGSSVRRLFKPKPAMTKQASTINFTERVRALVDPNAPEPAPLKKKRKTKKRKTAKRPRNPKKAL